MRIIVARHIWDSLPYRDPADFGDKPALATSDKWIDDKTLVFNLRHGVKFHNDETFDAAGVSMRQFRADPKHGVFNPRNVS